MSWSVPDISLLAVELLTAAALAVLWLGDRQRQYTLWWALAFSLMTLPILLATGYADLPSGTTTDLPRLAKPYQQTELATQISRLLTGRSTAQV